MRGFLFDSSMLLDFITADAVWGAWSRTQIANATEQNLAFINPIIYAELAPAFLSQADLDDWLNTAKFQRLPLPFEAGWRAGQAFVKYRRAGGARTSPLPDFYIGAHAEAAGLTLVTRDAAWGRTYFPAVALIAP